MPSQPLPYTDDPRPIDGVTFRLTYDWQSDGYSLRLAIKVHGSTEWRADTYGPVTLEEAVDIVAASLVR